MKALIATLSLITLGAAFSPSAIAQTRFCTGGDLDNLSQAQKVSCNAKLNAVRSAVASLHASVEWHYVVVCGEEGWKDYAAYAGNDAITIADANTNVQGRETFFRADRLDLSNQSALRSIVAHEVAAAVIGSADQVAIEQQVERWRGQGGQAAGL